MHTTFDTAFSKISIARIFEILMGSDKINMAYFYAEQVVKDASGFLRN